ncbi:MAG: aldo/keto reductase, partial [Phycisphaerales bacterium]|nr:aldo/keto reductase [Phycisphaerales bacterium]
MLALSIVMVASVFATSAPPTSSPTILITEIMFDPLSPERRGESEWVEIANVGASPVDLRGWRLDDEDTRASSEWGPFDVVLHPGAVAILVNEAAVTVEEFRAAWPSTGAAPPPILAPILPSPPPPDPAADRDADPAAGRDPEVGVRDGRRPNDDARGADHGRPGGGARSAASVAMVHIIPVRWGGLSNAPSATNEILRLRDEHDDIACEVNFACGESWPPCRSGFSLELIDAGGADPASGASWRRAAAGKHGATTSRAAGVFIGADVGSPGVVSGLTDIVFFGAPPPAGAGPPDHTPPNRAADPDRRRQFDDTIDFARRAGPSSSDSRPSDEPRRVVDASSPDRLHGAPDAMNYRRLGMWGIKLSEIGFGSWLNFNDSDQPHADALHRAAYETGINFFDTANAYGGQTTEVVVGRALAPFRRDTIVLATKLYWPLKDWPFPGANDRGLSRKHIFEQCDASLKRLGTDYIDLYQCHRYDDETPLVETCRAMNDLIAHGKVLYWGVSE